MLITHLSSLSLAQKAVSFISVSLTLTQFNRFVDNFSLIFFFGKSTNFARGFPRLELIPSLASTSGRLGGGAGTRRFPPSSMGTGLGGGGRRASTSGRFGGGIGMSILDTVEIIKKLEYRKPIIRKQKIIFFLFRVKISDDSTVA